MFQDVQLKLLENLKETGSGEDREDHRVSLQPRNIVQ